MAVGKEQEIRMALNRLAALMAALDAMLTDHNDNAEMKSLNLRKDICYSGHYVYYLSDGGYSRVVLHIEPDHGVSVFLTGNTPSSKSTARWYDADVLALRDMVSRALKAVSQVLSGS